MMFTRHKKQIESVFKPVQAMKRFCLLLVVGCLELAVCTGTGVAAAEQPLKIVIPPKADSRIVCGAEQLRAVIVRSGSQVRVVTGRPLALQPHTIAVGTARDGVLFKNVLKNVEGEEQGFALICRPSSSVLIAGADAAGALYGCIELIERLDRLNGRFPEELTFCDYPRMRLRGPCIPLMGKGYEALWTPEAFPWLYDHDWWIHYLDQLVSHRFNTLYIWNGHPFTSILKLSKYPEAQELDDSQLEANIELLKWLCAEAARRNIWIVIKHYNIYVSHAFARYHKLGSSAFKEPTPLTSEYMRYCYSEFIKNYPNIGLMLCLGEVLEDSLAPAYVRDVVIPGVKAGLKPGQPEPPIIIRGHQVPIFEVMAAAKQSYSNLYVTAKFNNECLASDQVGGGTDPRTHRHYRWESGGQAHLNLAKEFPLITNVHLVRNLEPFRWGAPDFIQRAMTSCVDTDIVGLHLYPLGFWIWPYSADKLEPRLQQIDRDWMWYSAWARYSWNPYRDRKEEQRFWTRQLAGKFGSENAGRLILAAYEHSGEVLPYTNRAFSCTSGGSPVNQIVQTLEQLFMSTRWYAPDTGECIVEYVRRQVEGRPHLGETPLDAADAMVWHSEAAVKAAEAANIYVTKNKVEFERFLDDIKAIRLVAKFYRKKVEAAIGALMYKSTSDIKQFFRCSECLTESVERFRELTSLLEHNYSAGTNLKELEAELSTIKHNADVLRQEPDLIKLLAKKAKPFPVVDVIANTPGQSVYKVDKQAKPYFDSDMTFGPGLSEQFVGLNSIKFLHKKAKSSSAKVTFTAKEPTKVFIAVKDPERERVRPGSWLDYVKTHKEIIWPYCNIYPPNIYEKYRKDPWAKVPSDWSLYIKGNTITCQICDIYWKDFPAGKSTIDVGLGVFVLLGFTKKTAKLTPWVGAGRIGSGQIFVQRIELK